MGNEKKKRNAKPEKKTVIQTQEKQVVKNEPKEQRQRRTSRTSESEGKARETPVVTKQDPAEPVGPEFYKNLKRETEEILKISDSAPSKFGKRQIESNWQKYETPVETYDSMEEEDEGADFEQLIHAPVSTGDHFQFKHEKLWGLDVKESEFDKYFEINMPTLALGLCTIPFQERNNLQETLFTSGEIKRMSNRAYKFKQKYYREADYEALPETVSNDKLLKILTEDVKSKQAESDIYSAQKSYEDDLDEFLEKVESPMLSNAKHKEKSSQVQINKTEDASENYGPDDGKFLDLTLNETLPPPKQNTVTEIKKLVEPEVEVDTMQANHVFESHVLEQKEDLEEWLDDFLSS